MSPRSLPIVSALRDLSRYAAPGTRSLVEAVAALSGELDWRQTYSRPISASDSLELWLERMDG